MCETTGFTPVPVGATTPAVEDVTRLADETGIAEPAARDDGGPLRVAVVICAYSDRRWEQLREAIVSIRVQRTPAHELLVVIDHNPALYRRVLLELPDVPVIENAGPRGLSGARNAGIEHVSSPIVAFLDDDARADVDWVERLVAGFREAHVVGVGGQVIPRWATGRPRWFPEEFDWVVGCTYRGCPTEPAYVRNLNGGGSAMRRAAVVEAGGYRTELGRVRDNFAGCEETELAIRIRRRHERARFLFDPSISTVHDAPVDRERFSYFWHRCVAEGRSKAIMVSLVGADAGLSAERTHATRNLPVAVGRGFADAMRGDLWGVARAAAVLIGLAGTAGGFFRTIIPLRVARRFRRKRLVAA